MPDHPKLPPLPQPTRIPFDPYNSSSTGHQICPSNLAGTTSWRKSRSNKLTHQFGDVSGRGGKDHISDQVGAGSKNWRKDGRKENGDWEPGAPGLRENGWQNIATLLSGSRKRVSDESEERRANKKRSVSVETTRAGGEDISQLRFPSVAAAANQDHSEGSITAKPDLPQMFQGLTIYLNGSTAPLVSDHRLKQLFAQHGGNSSINLGRRSVTHVILGKTCGGGLASSKIQKEVSLVGGKGIKYVTAQWVLDSIERGIRQPEGRYMPPDIAKRIGGSGQKSVQRIFESKVTGENG